MNDELFSQLLDEEESASLDFKEGQYSFAKASDEDKSELLKDILAFANAWRRSDAYILIGVRDVQGGRSIVAGLSEHLDDHCLQQFVNQKVNRPVHFSYQASTFEGKSVGVIKIDQQERPFYLKADYGKLRKGVVYIRRGSSTAEADPDEIARMGLGRRKESAELCVDFADAQHEAARGESIDLESVVCRVPSLKEIPDYGSFGGYQIGGLSRNQEYYRDLARFMAASHLSKPVRILIKNDGQVAANDVRLELEVIRQAGMLICDESQMPNAPVTNLLETVTHFRSTHARQPGDAHVEHHDDKFKIIVECGNIQPGRAIFSDKIFLGRDTPGDIQLVGRAYAENLPTPKDVSLVVHVTTSQCEVTLKDLLRMGTSAAE